MILLAGMPPPPHPAASLSSLPVIDLSGAASVVAEEIGLACRDWGAFVAVGHGIDPALLDEAIKAGHAFFDLPAATKEKYNLTRNGARWRGYMPLGGERSENGTLVDFKEGLYLGEDHNARDPRVLAGLPTFGTNVLPDDELPTMRGLMGRCLDEMRLLGDQCMDHLSTALGLEETYLRDHVTEHSPVVLPRLFRYPPQLRGSGGSYGGVGGCSGSGAGAGDTRSPAGHSAGGKEARWGIGRHSDYGLWTMILTDAPGLEFQHPVHRGWCKVPWIPGGIAMNVGDVLDRLTSGRFRSPYHRARNLSFDHSRISLPFFYDPGWNARMRTLPLPNRRPEEGQEDEGEHAATQERWAHTKIRCAFDGRVPYSEFLAKKVAKVFPDIIPRSLWRNIESTSAPSTRHALTVPVPEKRSTSALLEAIEKQRQRVLKHPLYDALRGDGVHVDGVASYSPPPLAFVRCFLEHHVWSVYDYFSLLKRLQRELTCTTVPWVPKGDRQLRRFINEIVLEEESDLFEDKETYGSHLELYLRAMTQVGADTGPMTRFLGGLRLQQEEAASGKTTMVPQTADSIADNAAAEGAPAASVAHIRSTLRLAMEGSTPEVAAVFAFGREDVIPSMFAQLLPSEQVGEREGEAVSSESISIFRYYLERHIELDGKDHGPIALRLVETLCGAGGTASWAAATSAVNAALADRHALWEAVRTRIQEIKEMGLLRGSASAHSRLASRL